MPRNAKNKSLTKRVTRVERAVRQQAPPRVVEAISINPTAWIAGREFSGQANTAQVSTASGYANIISSMEAGAGVLQERTGTSITVHRMWGTVRVELPPGATFSIGGIMQCRMIILKVVNLATSDAGAYIEPTLKEAFAVNATTTQGNLDTGLSIVQMNQKPRDRNYSIIYDRKFALVPQAGGGMTHKILKYHIRPPRGEHTTFIDDGQTISSCVSNHYLLYVFGINTLIANNVPLIAHYGYVQFSND